MTKKVSKEKVDELRLLAEKKLKQNKPVKK
jgi:hypothetical protein